MSSPDSPDVEPFHEDDGNDVMVGGVKNEKDDSHSEPQPEAFTTD